MLTTIGSGTSSAEASHLMDYARAYASSKLHQECLENITKFDSQMTDSNMIRFPSKYATDIWYQSKEVLKRQAKVYWRSPSYNRNRLIIGAVIALLFGKLAVDDAERNIFRFIPFSSHSHTLNIIPQLSGSVYASQRVPSTESQLNSISNSIYISVLFLGKFLFAVKCNMLLACTKHSCRLFILNTFFMLC